MVKIVFEKDYSTYFNVGQLCCIHSANFSAYKLPNISARIDTPHCEYVHIARGSLAVVVDLVKGCARPGWKPEMFVVFSCRKHLYFSTSFGFYCDANAIYDEDVNGI
jgi:hypothetical protein